MIELPQLTIRTVSVSDMANNVYLLTSRSSGDQVLIDAADDLPAIQRMLSDAHDDSAKATHLALVATTHSHWDHVRVLGDLVALTGAQTAAGEADVSDINVPTDVVLAHGDAGTFDGFELEVIGLRGHTPGSLAFLYRDPDGPAHLFSGDSVFPGGLGNTGNDPSRFASLYADVVDRVFNVLPDSTVVHPGHGASTTLGAERPHLQEWKSRGW
ncbi:MBL fold metallo-hydrolase [Arthrobacter roseus]|uniref:MBL fold metallo-hydrolase n=1 Tax=Arthrobacter roseus TaxID=136274 RepID=UPI001962D2EA|nr:MBL fold metallo-hydrolase [Arthrobacter roseus]MBM7848475.1 glyoxylase-like metal-dependent hydrolase (beta-lactamase superfamily II) [Arthrobacter roseus]